jgi:hypothetical protein
MIEAWAGKRVWAILGACLCCCLQPVHATPLPVRGEAVPNECTQAFALVAGHAPPMDLVDPGTWIVSCNGLALPTSLVGYYVELDSWSSVAVAENQHLKSQVPTLWSTWFARLEWAAVGLVVGFSVSALAFRVEP